MYVKNKEIACPRCHYHGEARRKPTNILFWMAWGALTVVSFLLPPLTIFWGIFMVWWLAKPVRMICPSCKYENPVSVELEGDNPDRFRSAPNQTPKPSLIKSIIDA